MKKFWFSVANGSSINVRVYCHGAPCEEPAILRKMMDFLNSEIRNDSSDLWSLKREFPEESKIIELIYGLIRHHVVKKVFTLPWFDEVGHSINIEFARSTKLRREKTANL